MSSRSDHDSIEAPRPRGSGGSCPERGPGREGPIDGAAGAALPGPGPFVRRKWAGTACAAAPRPALPAQRPGHRGRHRSGMLGNARECCANSGPGAAPPPPQAPSGAAACEFIAKFDSKLEFLTMQENRIPSTSREHVNPKIKIANKKCKKCSCGALGGLCTGFFIFILNISFLSWMILKCFLLENRKMFFAYQIVT